MTAGVGHFIELGRWPRVILEGVLKVAIFLSYMYLISRMKEIERVFRYPRGPSTRPSPAMRRGTP